MYEYTGKNWRKMKTVFTWAFDTGALTELITVATMLLDNYLCKTLYRDPLTQQSWLFLMIHKYETKDIFCLMELSAQYCEWYINILKY